MHSYDKVVPGTKEGDPVMTVKTDDFFMKENSNYLNKLETAEAKTSLKPILKPLSARNSRSNSQHSQTFERS